MTTRHNKRTTHTTTQQTINHKRKTKKTQQRNETCNTQNKQTYKQLNQTYMRTQTND